MNSKKAITGDDLSFCGAFSFTVGGFFFHVFSFPSRSMIIFLSRPFNKLFTRANGTCPERPFIDFISSTFRQFFV